MIRQFAVAEGDALRVELASVTRSLMSEIASIKNEFEQTKRRHAQQLAVMEARLALAEKKLRQQGLGVEEGEDPKVPSAETESTSTTR
jgi:hypothetical protein